MPSVGSAVMAWIQSTGGLFPIGNVKRGRTSHDSFCTVTIRSLWFALSWVIPHPIVFVLAFGLTWPPRKWGEGCSHHSQNPWKNPGLFLGQHGHFGWNTLAGAGVPEVPLLARSEAPVYTCFHSLSLRVRSAIKNDNLYFFPLYFHKTLKKLELLNFILGKTSELAYLVSLNFLLLSIHN